MRKYPIRNMPSCCEVPGDAAKRFLSANMNRNILTFLNEYAEISDPQYAIMLRGAWGCGKTFFIRQWIKQLKNDKDADKLKWRPIYVSLYGLTTTQQITEQVNKEISPWLYSKGMKLAKNILKAASKIALKYDIDGDGKDEGSVTCDLDSILLLKEENSEIKGNKILIFDDLERCDVKLETLLGYINYFTGNLVGIHQLLFGTL